ncbi:MAG: FMN-binding protein [Lentisphaeria bacterium]|nr:FMN-binding protein [Lentisphaeria bacterium]
MSSKCPTLVLFAFLMLFGIGSVTRGEEGVKRSRKEVRALIEEAGRTKPDWWDETAMNHPNTLDLTWPKAKGKWNANKNIGQYIVSVVNRRPERWRPTAKLVHTLVLQRKPSTERGMRDAMGWLGHLYARFLGDYARGAYWWEKLQKEHGSLSRGRRIDLAECYAKLGNTKMAEELLRRIDRGTIKAWSDLGRLDRALKQAESETKRKRPYSALMAAGDACRAHGEGKKARTYYTRLMRMAKTGGGRNKSGKKYGIWARQAIAAIKAFAKHRPGRYPDGTHEGEGTGYRGAVRVRMTVDKGRITQVKVLNHREDWPGRAPMDIPRQLVEKQGISGVDAVTGATRTSDAILAACGDALAKAKRK